MPRLIQRENRDGAGHSATELFGAMMQKRRARKLQSYSQSRPETQDRTRRAGDICPNFTVAVWGHLNAAILIFYLGLSELEPDGKVRKDRKLDVRCGAVSSFTPHCARLARSAEIGLLSVKLLSSQKSFPIVPNLRLGDLG